MINLYIDFDGVLVDTINETYRMIAERGISLDDTEKVAKFYRELDWNELLSNTKEINNAFENISALEDSVIYKPCILTTVHSTGEMKAKIMFIRSRNKNINVICVPKGIEKCEMVDPRNAILIDDFGGNLKSWVENGGIGIKFSEEDSNKYMTISSLDELINQSSITLVKKKKID